MARIRDRPELRPHPVRKSSGRYDKIQKRSDQTFINGKTSTCYDAKAAIVVKLKKNPTYEHLIEQTLCRSS